MITNEAPKWLRWAAIGFIAWNLMGVWSFITNWQLSAAGYAGLPQVQRDLWTAMPGWTWVAYAIAVGGGVAGAGALLLRSAIAVPLFLVSFLAILAQFSWPIFMTDAFSKMGMELVVFPIILALVALAEWLFSRKWRAKGWLG